MAYKVFFNLPKRELGKTDIKITIFRDTRRRKLVSEEDRKNVKLGDLLLSKGGVEWKGKRRSWLKIAQWIEDSA